MTPSSPRVARPAAFSDDMEYEDKHAFPPANRSRVGSPRHSVSSVSSMSSVKNSPAPPSNAKSFANSPTPTNLRTRHSESELHSPRNRSQMDEYPRYEAKKKMSADFSDDTMSVGSIGGESPKSDKGSWRIHSAVAGPFLTGPLARDFRSEDLKTPRGKARDDMNFDQTGLLFPLAPVLDVIPDTPRGPHRYHSQGFTDVSRFGNNAQALDGFNLDGGAAAYPSEPARPTTAFNSARRGTNPQVHDNNYANYANQSDYESAQYAADGQQYNHENGHQSSAIVASQGNSSASHAPSYAGIVARNAASSSEQSLVSSSSTASDSLETLTKGMADSMAQILAKTQNGRSYGEVQLTTLVQKIHMHMNIMGRTSAAIREDYNKIKAKLEQTITDKKVLEATNYHLQQLVQQYEVERQYFHQYVLHSLQSQSSLIYESMGNLTQNVAQSKYTIEELSARLSQELTNMRGSHTNGNESQLKDILEEIKRAVDMSVLHNQNNNNGTQHSFDAGSHSNQASSRSPHANSTPSKADSTRKEQDAAGSGKFVPFLLALLLWVATLAGVYYGAKSSALSELQGQQPSSSSSGALLPSDLDSIVDQISQKLESVVQTSDVRKLVYSELTENPHLVESIGSVVDKDVLVDDSEPASSLPKDNQDAKVEQKSRDSVETPPSDSGSADIPVPGQAAEVADNLDIPPWASIHMPGSVAPEKADVVEEVMKAEEKIVEDAALNAESDVTPQIPTDSSLPVQDSVDDATMVEVEVTAMMTDDISDPLATMFDNDATSSPNVVTSEPKVAAEPLVGHDSTTETKFESGASEQAVAVSDGVESPDVSESAVGTSVPDVSTVLPGSEESSVVVPESEEDIAEEDVPADISSDFVEVALESAVNPDIVATSNPVLEPAVESAILASTDADAVEEVDAGESGALEIDFFEGGVFEDVDASHVIITDAEVETPLDSSDDAANSIPVATEEEVVVASEDAVSSSAIDDKVENAALESSMDAALARFQEELSASTPVEEDVDVKVSENNASSKDDEDVADVQVDASDSVLDVISVDDETKEESPFSGLSMALRSLARRIVGDVDVGFFSSEDSAEPVDDTIPENHDLESQRPVSSELDEKPKEVYEATTFDSAEVLVVTHEDTNLIKDAAEMQTIDSATVESQAVEPEVDAAELSDDAVSTEDASEEAVDVAQVESLVSETDTELTNEEVGDTQSSSKVDSLEVDSFDEDVAPGIAPSEGVEEPGQTVETVSEDDVAEMSATSDSVASELLQSVENDVVVLDGIESASVAETDVEESAKDEDANELDELSNDVPELRGAEESLNVVAIELSSGAGEENTVEEVIINDDVAEELVLLDTVKTLEDEDFDLLKEADSATLESQNEEGDLEMTGADSLINVAYDVSNNGSIEAVADEKVDNLEDTQAVPEIEAEIVSLQNVDGVADVAETEPSSVSSHQQEEVSIEEIDGPQSTGIQSTDPATSSDSKFTIDASDIVNEITPASEDLSADDIIARTESSVGTEDAEDDSDADGSVESVIPPSESPVEDQESSPLIDPIEPSIISVPDNELDVSAFESSAAGVIEVIDTTYDVAVEPELIESSDDEAQIDVATADEIEAIEPSTGDIETAVESLDEDADPISPSLVSSQEKSSTVDADILEIDESAKTEGEKEPETTLEVEDALSGKSDKQPEDVIVADLTGSAESPAAAASMTTNVGGDVDASTTLATETSVNDPESSKSTALEDTETSFEPADTSEEAVLPSDDE